MPVLLSPARARRPILRAPARRRFLRAPALLALALAAPLAALPLLAPAPAAWAQTAPAPNPPAASPQPVPVPPAPPAPAQSPPAPTPAPANPPPASPAPLSPPPALPAPGAPAAPGTAPGTAPSAPAPNADLGLPTLAPAPADPASPDELTLTAKPLATVSGTGRWDDGFETLKSTIARLRETLRAANIPVTGRPLTLFVETNDETFRYEVSWPIAAAPTARPPGLPAEVIFGQSPAGRVVRFTHRAPYEEIDGTYEAITAFLESRNVTVQDRFVEEYVSDLTTADDSNLDINIYVLPR